MNIKILKFNSEECFEKEKFNIPFKYKDAKYEVTVYLRRVQNTELEESILIGRSYDGEYILDGAKLLFCSVIYMEKYNLNCCNKLPVINFTTYKKI